MERLGLGSIKYTVEMECYHLDYHSPCALLSPRISHPGFFGIQQLGLARSWIYSKTKLNILQVDIFYPKMFVRYVFYVSFIADSEWGPLDPMNHAQE